MAVHDYRYLLDTNIVSELLREPQGTVARRIARVGERRVCTSIVVACELRYGAQKKGSQRLSQQLEAILGALPVLALEADRKSTRLNSSHIQKSRMPSSA